MDERGALVFIIFCVIGIVGLCLFYALKFSRRFAGLIYQGEQQQREQQQTTEESAV
jgi:hypothetical protein